MSPRHRAVLIIFAALVFASSIGTVFALNRYDPDIYPSFSSSGAGGGVGTGTLYVYIDPQRTTEALTNPADNYIVIVHTSYYFSISGITEYSTGQIIKIWALYQDQTEQIGSYDIGQGGTVDFIWTIPGLPSQTEIKYKYGLSPNPDWRFAKKTTHGVALTLVIPQVPLAVLGSTSALFAAFAAIKTTSKKKRQ